MLIIPHGRETEEDGTNSERRKKNSTEVGEMHHLCYLVVEYP